jgi:hypothetical protein
MGTGNSRTPAEQRARRAPGSAANTVLMRKKRRRAFFSPRLSTVITQAVVPAVTQAGSRRPVHSRSSQANSTVIFGPAQPQLQPFYYSNYPTPSYMPSQPMMMMSSLRPPPPQAMPQYMYPSSPPTGMPMSTPYMPQPVYSPVARPTIASTSSYGGTGYYPSSYPIAPGRLLTDWTGGGVISPGFLGPPI